MLFCMSEPGVYCGHSYIQVDLCSSVGTSSNSRLAISFSSRYKSVTLLSALRIIVSVFSIQHLRYPRILSNTDIDCMGPLFLQLGEMILENTAMVDDDSLRNHSILCFRSTKIKSTSIPIDLKAVGVQASLWVAPTVSRVNPTSTLAHWHQCSNNAHIIPFVKQDEVGDCQLFIMLNYLLPVISFIWINATCFSPPSITFSMESGWTYTIWWSESSCSCHALYYLSSYYFPAPFQGPCDLSVDDVSNRIYCNLSPGAAYEVHIKCKAPDVYNQEAHYWQCSNPK